MGLGDTPASASHRAAAGSTCALLALGALLAAIFGQRPGPQVGAFVPIAATVWALADLLTASLLLAQFYINGRLSFAILTLAYAVSGLLTWPYLLAFPGLFAFVPVTPGSQQISLYLWMFWHSAFPAIVLISIVNDSPLKRLASRGAVRSAAVVVAVAPLVIAAAVTAFVFAERDALPPLIVAERFQPLNRDVLLPSIIALDIFVCAALLVRGKRLTTLQLWLCVAIFSAVLDAVLLTFCPTRYSYAWDAGKLITVFAASTVLVVILFEIAGLYARLARVARIDALTSIPNRRAFEEHLAIVYGNAARSRTAIALLMLDIDLFKVYNDSYGHTAGDECLGTVARALAASATRPLDLIARYGGEEFVAVLPDTPPHGVLIVAERMRRAVQALEIWNGRQKATGVTVSIGIGYASDAATISAAALLHAADGRLYAAKARGRNRVLMGSAAAGSFGSAPVAGTGSGVTMPSARSGGRTR